MAPELAPRVEDFIANPDSDESVELVIRVSDEDLDEVISEVEGFGARYVRELPLDCHLIETTRDAVSDIARIDGIDRIEENAEFEEFGSGK